MEIKVGEFIRTKDGIISKVIDVLDGYSIDCDEDVFELGNGSMMMEIPWTCKGEIIKKHSFNIKELIDENDIVEYRINSLSELKVGRVKKYRDARNNKQYLGIEGFDITKIYIISIFTETKYKQERYVVEEEKDE